MDENLSPEELEEYYQQAFNQSSQKFPESVDVSEIFETLIDEWKKLGFPTPKGLKPGDFPGFNDDHFEYLDLLLEEVESVRLSLLHGTLPPVKVGPMNNGLLNAFNQPTMLGNGYLILIDTGLLSFTYLAGKILLEATPTFLPDDGRKSNSSVSHEEDVAESTDWNKETLSADAMIKRLDELIENSITSDPRISDRIPFSKEFSLEFSPVFSEACTRFVIAHEMGHAIAREIEFPTVLDDEQNMNPIVVEEFNCDWFAMQVAIEIYLQKSNTVTGVNEQFSRNMELIAPIIFFDLMFCCGLKRAFLGGSSKVNSKDHPPDLIRKERLIKILLERIGLGADSKILLDTYKVFAQHTTRYTQYLIDDAKKKGIDTDNIRATWNY